MSQNTSQADHRDEQGASLDSVLLNAAHQSEFSRRSLIKGLFAAAGAAVLFGVPTTAHAASATKETLNALSEAQAEYDAMEEKLDAIADQYQTLSEKQSQTMQDIEDVQDQIDEIQAEIDEKQAELEMRQESLADRVSASYKNGGNDAITLLLSSTSFDELISNVYYVDKISERDREDIAEINDIQAELERRQSELEEQKAELEELKEKQAEQLADMQNKQAEAQELLNNLDDEVQELIEKRDAELLASARAEAAAAEEARRQQAAQSSGGYTPQGGSGQSLGVAGNAQQRVVNACHSTPSPGLGWCAAWVSQVFQRAGLGRVAGNACDMYSNWCTSSNKSNLQVGMIVAVSTHSHTAAGRIWGHVGIYVGNNMMMDNIGYIRTINVDTWCSFYGTTVTPRWGWANGINLAG